MRVDLPAADVCNLEYNCGCRTDSRAALALACMHPFMVSIHCAMSQKTCRLSKYITLHKFRTHTLYTNSNLDRLPNPKRGLGPEAAYHDSRSADLQRKPNQWCWPSVIFHPLFYFFLHNFIVQSSGTYAP